MDCPFIHNLTLEKGDVEALEAIRKIYRDTELLAIALPVGVLHTLFTKNNGIGASYNIATHEWRTFAVAMTTMPLIQKHQVEKVAKLRAMDIGLSHEQRQFWRSVGRGCSVSPR